MFIHKLSQEVEISGIDKKQIYKNGQFESLIVAVKKDTIVPAQPAPADAGLYLISGKIEFEISGKKTLVETDDFFSFSEGEMHALKALEDSKFIISRNLFE
ncbi:cupin domain-containing protein [Ancylomarina sp. YFZ004]